MHVQDTETLLYIVNRPYTYFINIKQYTQVVSPTIHRDILQQKLYYIVYCAYYIDTIKSY